MKATIAIGEMVPLSELTYPQISLACTTKKVFEMIAADLDYSDENDWSLILEDDVLINPKAFPNPRKLVIDGTHFSIFEIFSFITHMKSIE